MRKIYIKYQFLKWISLIYYEKVIYSQINKNLKNNGQNKNWLRKFIKRIISHINGIGL